MEQDRSGTMFGRFFPWIFRGALVGALLLWGVSIGRSVLEKRPPVTEVASSEINWQDITPTCDIVLCALGKAHATVQDYLEQLTTKRCTIEQFDSQLAVVKRQLRKVNIGGIEEPELQTLLLQLRQQQIALYTTMREDTKALHLPVDMGASGKAEPGVAADLWEKWRRECEAFSGKLTTFAMQANVLMDEIPDKRAAATIFFAKPKNMDGE